MFVLTTRPRQMSLGYTTLDKLIANETIRPEVGKKAEQALLFVNKHLQTLVDKMQLNIVKLNTHDIYSAELSMAKIIYPALIRLQKEKKGAPKVDFEDVPENLQPNISEIMAYERQGETDDKYFKRYDYVIGEMIFAFEYIVNEKQFAFDQYDEVEFKRVENGLRLFAKYYFSLWD
jgi:hypothetical protein